MIKLLLIYDPTTEDWLLLFGGVFCILLVAYLFTKYTKYGGESNYGITEEFDEFDDYSDYY